MSHMNRGLLAVSPELLVQALCLPSSTEIVGVGTRRDIGGHLVPVVNASVFFSEVGERLCQLYPDAPFAGYYFDRLAAGKRQ